MMTDAYHGLPTPRTTLRARYVSLLVWCKGGCQHQAEADLHPQGKCPSLRICRQRVSETGAASRSQGKAVIVSDAGGQRSMRVCH